MLDVITDHIDVWTSAQKKKASVGRGSNSTFELYGIKKLRELILGMALKGKFQHENESLTDNINDLLDVAKEKYYKKIDKKPKQYSYGPALLNEFLIPSGWKWKRIGDLCDLQTGATPSRQKSEYFGGDIPWLVSGDINQGVIYDCEGRITEKGLKSSNCRILPKNTVLIALNGQGKTRATVALLKLPATCNQSLVGIIPYDELIIDSSFLLLALRYRYYEIRDITGQKQRRGLNMGLVSELSIPLPPLSEQHCIVAKVDELMALCDQLEQDEIDNKAAHQTLVKTLFNTLISVGTAEEFAQSWQRISEHFDVLFTTEESIEELKQTILQLAVMGKLLPQDPNDEPASELLKKIEEEKERLVEEKKIKKPKKLQKVNDDECVFDVPQGWSWVKFGELSEFINGDRGKNYPNKNEYVESGVAWINTGHIEPNGCLTKQAMNFITREKYETLRGGKIEKDDLVYCLRGATFGKTAFVKPYQEGAIASSLMIIRPYMSDLNNYIFKYLISPFGKGQVFRFNNGSAQPNLSANSVQLYAFPLPPLEEQNRIVNKVDELMALCDTLKANISEAQDTQVLLANAIVEQAIQ